MVSPVINDVDVIVGFAIVIQNKTEQKLLEKRLKYLRLHDALTGLYNRGYFEYESLRLEGKQHVPVGLIVCDVDGLKIINDTMGHKIGDNLLISAANILKKSFREEDLVARIGGDEFAVLLSDSPAQVVGEACQRIRDNIIKVGYSLSSTF